MRQSWNGDGEREGRGVAGRDSERSKEETRGGGTADLTHTRSAQGKQCHCTSKLHVARDVRDTSELGQDACDIGAQRSRKRA